MFKKIMIELTGPICSCKNKNLAWRTFDNKEGKPNLEVWCQDCKTVLRVPTEKFIADWKFDTPYPGEKMSAEPKPKLTIMDGGKVLPFVRPTDEQQEPKNSA